MHVSQERGKRRVGQDMAISIQADGNVNIDVNFAAHTDESYLRHSLLSCGMHIPGPL